MSSSNGPKDDKKPKVGRVKHDASGRAIWEWAAETGRNALDSTSRLLKRLELPGLSILDDDKGKPEAEEEAQPGSKPVPTFGGPAEKDPLANARRSFNPYDKNTPARAAAPSRKPAAKPVAKPVARPGFLGRLFGRK